MIYCGKYTQAEIFTDSIEMEAYKQIVSMCNDEVFTNPIKIMPDVHAGKGSTIGFTMKCTDKIVPNIIGVDISCGVESVNIKTDYLLNKEILEKIAQDIVKEIPMGFSINKDTSFKVNDILSITHMPTISKFIKEMFGDKYSVGNFFTNDYIRKLFEKINLNEEYFLKSIGTLGGGNHFIEIEKENENSYYLTVHSGSRKFGLMVCSYWQNKAKEYSKKEEFSYLKEEDAVEYLCNMFLCEIYANLNRGKIIHKLLDIIERYINFEIDNSILSIHNYLNFNDFIIRKGAISAHEDETVIIPLNMKEGIIIGKGKGNEEWNYSAPHGAGRLMSRSKAKKVLSFDEFKKTMKDIVSPSINEKTLDEAPMAYKDKEEIIDKIKETIEIISIIKPILNVKG